MNFSNFIAGVCAGLFLMIGADKFLHFMDPPCSIMGNISPTIWKTLGVLQLAGGILIMIPKLRRPVAIFFTLFMLFFIIYHLTQNTYDVGGAVSMMVLLGLLIWNPEFLRGGVKKSN